MSYQRRVLLLILIVSALKLLYSTTTGLAADEVYYWSFASNLQWNYFDHPPMVAWLIRLTTANLYFHNELSVRLGAIICSAACTWLIFKLGTLINNLQTGWFAALLYTSSLYCSIVIGTSILPDSPQMIFWLISIVLLIKISRLTEDLAKANLLWCLFGLSTGLCIMSKIHGVFIWLGAILYVMMMHRHWLKSRGIYLAAGITLIVTSPILIWNIQNHFVTYQFHSSRISPNGSSLNLTGFGKAILGQVNSNNPINFILIVSSLISFLRGELPANKKEMHILLYCSLPLIITIFIISLSKETYSYWPGPAYSSLLVFPAVQMTINLKRKGKIIPGIIKWAFAYLVVIALLQILIINYFPGTVSEQKQGLKTGEGDLTLDSYGWRNAGNSIDSIYRSDIEKNLMPVHSPIVITNWDIGALTEFYIADKTNQEVIGMGSISDLHQYHWTNAYKKQLKDGDDVYLVIPSDGFNYRTFGLVNHCFYWYENPEIITQYRSGMVCRYIFVYRMHGYRSARK